MLEVETANNVNVDIPPFKIPKIIRQININDTSEKLHSFLSACIFKEDILDLSTVKVFRSFFIIWPFVPSLKPTDASSITSMMLEKLSHCSYEPLNNAYLVCFLKKEIQNGCNGYFVNFSISSNVRFTRNAIQRVAGELFVTLGNEPLICILKKQKEIGRLSKFQNIERCDLLALHVDLEAIKKDHYCTKRLIN